MLTALRVGNFKAFGATQTLPLKPITLIFGPNSSGKSSLIHALLLAHEAERVGKLDVFRTEIGGDSVDLGGFRQYVYRRNAAQRVEWGFELDARALKDRLGVRLEPADRIGGSLSFGFELDNEGEPKPGADPKVDAYSVDIDGTTFLRASRRADGHLRLDHLNHQHPCFRDLVSALVLSTTTAARLEEADYAAATDAIAELVPEITIPLGNLLPRSRAPERSPVLMPISRGQRRADLASAIQLVLPWTLHRIVNGITEGLVEELHRLRYLGPLRSYPPRHLAADQYHDPNWLAGGGHAYDLLRRDEEIRASVNHWLGDAEKLSTCYEVVVRPLVTIEDLEPFYALLIGDIWQRESKALEESDSPAGESEPELDPTLNKVLNFLRGDTPPDDTDYIRETEEALSKLKKLEPRLSRFQLLELKDKRNETIVTHRDVGIGVSQVLPVLVNAYGSTRSIVAIEQPEIHLHPGLQSELADVFIESALGERKNTFILETHSEHLILRVLRRIRETADDELPKDMKPIRPSDVAVLYVQPSGKGAEVVEIKATDDGEFATPWPNGFFAERARELF